MFKRFFFLWLSFFVVCILSIGTFALFQRWQAARTLEQADTKGLTTACVSEFMQQSKSGASPIQWDWRRLASNWRREFLRFQAMALVDSVDGKVKFATGEFSSEWNPLVDDPGDTEPHWVNNSSGEHLWTVVPAPSTDKRYRLWIKLEPPLAFSKFLHDRRYYLSAEGMLFLLLFILFYARLGSPTRYLTPMVGTLQRSLDRADSPLRIAPSSVPGEFAPLAKSLSLILEARQTDYEERHQLKEKDQHFEQQKTNYYSMINSLKSLREHDQTAVEKVQAILLEANREPVLILDRTRRILSMNEPARKILALAGQTGTTLRHAELEAILEAELQHGARSGPHRLTTKDLFSGKPSTWRVRVVIQSDWKDASQIQCIVVYLTQERAGPSSAGPSQDLLQLLASALGEAWTGQASHPCPIVEGEQACAEALVKATLTASAGRERMAQVLAVFGIDPYVEKGTGLLESEAAGTKILWQAFHDWFEGLLKRMAEDKPKAKLALSEGSRPRIEWVSENPFRFDAWFLSGNDPVRTFRKELLQQSLERLEAQMIWHPSSPRTFSLEIVTRPLPKARVDTIPEPTAPERMDPRGD